MGCWEGRCEWLSHGTAARLEGPILDVVLSFPSIQVGGGVLGWKVAVLGLGCFCASQLFAATEGNMRPCEWQGVFWVMDFVGAVLCTFSVVKS